MAKPSNERLHVFESNYEAGTLNLTANKDDPKAWFYTLMGDKLIGPFKSFDQAFVDSKAMIQLKAKHFDMTIRMDTIDVHYTFVEREESSKPLPPKRNLSLIS